LPGREVGTVGATDRIGLSVRIADSYRTGRRCAAGTLRAQQKTKRRVFERISWMFFLFFGMGEVRAEGPVGAAAFTRQ
jgi:hypothetical protein